MSQSGKDREAAFDAWWASPRELQDGFLDGWDAATAHGSAAVEELVRRSVPKGGRGQMTWKPRKTKVDWRWLNYRSCWVCLRVCDHCGLDNNEWCSDDHRTKAAALKHCGVLNRKARPK